MIVEQSLPEELFMKNGLARKVEDTHALDTLALDGGNPVRTHALPYGRQTVDQNDIDAVTAVLKSDFLTCGPVVLHFESAFARHVNAKHAISVTNGTAALHAAYYALGLKPGDEVLVPAMTFAATANAVVQAGGTPVFCDVSPNTLLIDSESVKKKITRKTKGIAAVDYAGQPCDFSPLREIADAKGLWIVEDACHSLGGTYQKKSVGSIADCTVFSFHPVKLMTTGEGGMITTQNPDVEKRLTRFRNHGITTNVHDREKKETWFYEMEDLGYNYRLTDLQCALGMSQLKHVGDWIKKRRQIAKNYDEALSHSKLFSPLATKTDREHSYHLYVVQLDLNKSSVSREVIYKALRAEGIAVNVHYIPVHLHPYYRRNYQTAPGQCPQAEAAYERILSLPIFPGMNQNDQLDVLEAIRKIEKAYAV